MYISRRPNAADKPLLKAKEHVAVAYDVSNHPAYHHEEEEDNTPVKNIDEPQDDGVQYSMFDINVDSIDVTLSLWRWFDGKGLIKDAEIRGVRGVLGQSLFILP